MICYGGKSVSYIFQVQFSHNFNKMKTYIHHFWFCHCFEKHSSYCEEANYARKMAYVFYSTPIVLIRKSIFPNFIRQISILKLSVIVNNTELDFSMAYVRLIPGYLPHWKRPTCEVSIFTSVSERRPVYAVAMALWWRADNVDVDTPVHPWLTLWSTSTGMSDNWGEVEVSLWRKRSKSLHGGVLRIQVHTASSSKYVSNIGIYESSG